MNSSLSQSLVMIASQVTNFPALSKNHLTDLELILGEFNLLPGYCK